MQEVEESLDIMRQTQHIKPVKVKAILENFTSSLEYLANDTYDNIFLHAVMMSAPKYISLTEKESLLINFSQRR
ncbi:hypothetical protein ACVXHB_16625 [Escherichia coli]